MDVLPPFDNQAFSEHNKGKVKLQLLLAAISEEVMLEALHLFYGKPHTRAIYTGVSGDVTWMKHGHTSHLALFLLFLVRQERFWIYASSTNLGLQLRNMKSGF